MLLLFLSCSERPRNHLTFWALGREGEVVAQMIPEFERRTGIDVEVQQLPWTAAHEKLLTAYVGESVPDVAQVGNTWIPEFEAINAVDDLTARVASSKSVDRSDYFDGIWATNEIGGRTYGIPWYVDTRVLFYRTDLLAAAGFPNAPRTWSEWRTAMARLRQRGHYGILLPTDEWPQPVILALQSGSVLVNENGEAAFRDPRFHEGFDFYVSLFRDDYAPVFSRTQVANRYLQFAQGEFAMMITGPWEVAEFRTRIPADKQNVWTTAPLPARDGTPWPGVSLAGGSSLVIFRQSERKDAAWKLIEYLSEPAQQIRFFELMRNLPARKSAWNAPVLRDDPHLRAFRIQLDRTVPTPKIPEWERLATMIAEYGERAIRTRATTKQVAAALDANANQILAKRRWMLARKAEAPLQEERREEP
ncbi:MAG TPA: sugar ABC transporter substrate-binding protein [Thermoanaerobaculia bacterium]|nr:sugar ABC transporter substrate-binding protein [Thermoanaerobaculia bacterium]